MNYYVIAYLCQLACDAVGCRAKIENVKVYKK